VQPLEKSEKVITGGRSMPFTPRGSRLSEEARNSDERTYTKAHKNEDYSS